MEGYTIIDEYDSGSFAQVYLVEKDGINYASKKIHVDDVGMEVELLITLYHPNIVRPVDYVYHDDYVHIIMDLMSPLVIKDERTFLWQMLSAIDYMHKNDITHADLKPSNILMLEGVPIIIDLGLSFYTSEGSDYNIQTVGYDAPEVRARKEYDEKIDIYSLGMIMANHTSKEDPMVKMMLTHDPMKRPSAEELMKMPYFNGL